MLLVRGPSPGAPLRAAPPSPARGEGKTARAARAENFHCNEKRASENVRTSRRLLRRVEACAPSTTLLRRVVPLPRYRGGGRQSHLPQALGVAAENFCFVFVAERHGVHPLQRRRVH